MRIPREDEYARRATDHKVRWLGGLLTLAGVLLAASSGIFSPAWISSVALAFGGTLISIGALSLVFDIALKRNIYEEMYNLSGLNKNIAENQFFGSFKSGDINWDDVVFERSNFKFVIQDPSRFIDQVMSKLFDAARERAIDICVLVPDTSPDIVVPLSAVLGVDEPELALLINQAVRRIEGAWNYRKDRATLAVGSKIEVRAVQAIPLYSLAVCDSLTIISIAGPFGRNAEISDYCYVHLGHQNSFPSEWFRGEIDDVATSPIRFADEVN